MTGNRSFQQAVAPYEPKVCRNNLTTTEGKPKCSFEMFVIHHPGIQRKFPPADLWTFRGDQFNDPAEKFLGVLLNRFLRDARLYKKVIIRNNTKPSEHPDHEVLVYEDGVISRNRLELHDELLKYMYKKIPVELEWKAIKDWKKSL